MKDRIEFLESIAKKAGIEVRRDTDGTLQDRPVLVRPHYVQGWLYGGTEWNPMRESADAFELAVLLQINVTFGNDGEAYTVARRHEEDSGKRYHWESDRFAATREAIVVVASKIQEG